MEHVQRLRLSKLEELFEKGSEYLLRDDISPLNPQQVTFLDLHPVMHGYGYVSLGGRKTRVHLGWLSKMAPDEPLDPDEKYPPKDGRRKQTAIPSSPVAASGGPAPPWQRKPQRKPRKQPMHK